jgi:ribosomal protein S18 acetylase RimI-like enzyme
VTQQLGVTLARYDSRGAEPLAGEVADLYWSVYGSKEPQSSNPFYARDAFLARLGRYRAGPGYELVTARDGRRLIGFAYGYRVTPASTWWDHLQPRPPDDFLEEDGNRTFAVNDMVVALDWQRRGIALAMHDELRASHPGMRFTLTVRPDNVPARTAYLRWGYRVIGQAQPLPGSPTYDMMLLDFKGT